jgi:hypothetical protein
MLILAAALPQTLHAIGAILVFKFVQFKRRRCNTPKRFSQELLNRSKFCEKRLVIIGCPFSDILFDYLWIHHNHFTHSPVKARASHCIVG